MKASGVADVVLQSPVTVQVRVAIDDSGKVTKVTPLSTATNNFRLVDSAVHAARFWTFAPAQLNGRPVTSEMILEFRFGR